jgi:hypothetical protein
MKLLVNLASINDVAVLSDARSLPIEICARDDQEAVRTMAASIASLLQDFDYLRSTEFEEAVEGKSAAVVAMKRRLALDAVKQAEQRRRFENALGDVLTSDEAYALVPRQQHSVIRGLIETAARLHITNEDHERRQP